LGRTQDFAWRTATAYVIGKASLAGCAAEAPTSSRFRAANPVPGLADADEALTAFLGDTTLALIGTGAAARGGLGLAAVTGEPAHPRDGGYRTTNKCGAEHPKRFAPRNGAVS
jgi:hypothetical protein